MAIGLNVTGDMVVSGTARIAGGITPGLARSSLAQDELKPFTVPMSLWRKNGAYNTPLAAAAEATHLACVAGTHGTNCPTLQTQDCGANGGADTYTARCEIPIPAEYDAGQTVTLRFHAGMQVIADEAATLDVAVYSSDEDSTVSASDLYTGAAQSINSATFADYDFTLTATNLSAGDILDVLITVSVNDTDTATDYVTAKIGAVKLLCDVKG
jgi:hypothetical protein